MKALKLFKRILQKPKEDDQLPEIPQTLKNNATHGGSNKEKEEEMRKILSGKSAGVKEEKKAVAAHSLKDALLGNKKKTLVCKKKVGEDGKKGKMFNLKLLIGEFGCKRTCNNFMARMKPNLLVRNPYIIPNEEYVGLMEARYKDEMANTVEDIKRRARKIIANKKKKKVLQIIPCFNYRKALEMPPIHLHHHQFSTNHKGVAQVPKAAKLKEMFKSHLNNNSCKRAIDTKKPKSKPQPKSNHPKEETWKMLIRNSSSEDEGMSVRSSSSRFDVKNSSASSLSSSGSSASSSFRAKWENHLSTSMPSITADNIQTTQGNKTKQGSPTDLSSHEDHCLPPPCSHKDFWITTDSEFVVLEI